MDNERYHCARCTMGFDVVDEFQSRGERMRCPDCKLSFHSSTNTFPKKTSTVSVRRRDVATEEAA